MNPIAILNFNFVNYRASWLSLDYSLLCVRLRLSNEFFIQITLLKTDFSSDKGMLQCNWMLLWKHFIFDLFGFLQTDLLNLNLITRIIRVGRLRDPK